MRISVITYLYLYVSQSVNLNSLVSLHSFNRVGDGFRLVPVYRSRGKITLLQIPLPLAYFGFGVYLNGFFVDARSTATGNERLKSLPVLLRCVNLLLLELPHQLLVTVSGKHSVKFLAHTFLCFKILRVSPTIFQIRFGFDFNHCLPWLHAVGRQLSS